MSETQRRATNADRVLAYLQQHRVASNAELLDIGGFRYGARVHDARQQGHRIRTEKLAGGLTKYHYEGFTEPGTTLPLPLAS